MHGCHFFRCGESPFVRHGVLPEYPPRLPTHPPIHCGDVGEDSFRSFTHKHPTRSVLTKLTLCCFDRRTGSHVHPKTCPSATAVLRSLYLYEQKGKMCLHQMSKEPLERRRTGARCAEIVHTTAATMHNVRAHKFIHIRPHHSKCKISILTSPLHLIHP